MKPNKTFRDLSPPILLSKRPLILFDGASANGICGVGFVLKLVESKEIKGWLNAGRDSNTRVEIIGLWSGLYVARWRGVRELFVAGDSQVIINWALDKALGLSLELFHWLNDSKGLMSEFNCCFCFHIYQELMWMLILFQKLLWVSCTVKYIYLFFLNGSCHHRETVCFSR